MPKNREKTKRRFEAKTAKKTIYIMSSFLTCRFIFLLVIVFRQTLNFQNSNLFQNEKSLSSQNVLSIDIFYLFELTLMVFSFFSCILNPLTFILFTDHLKNEAHDYIVAGYLFLKERIIHKNKVQPSN